MISGKQLRGLAVYAAGGQDCTRKALGRVVDLVADSGSGRVSGLVVSSDGLLARSYYLPVAAISRLDLSGVYLAQPRALRRLPRQLEGERQLGRSDRVLLDQTGRETGVVADVLLEGANLSGLEISAGISRDLRERRKFLPWSKVRRQEGNFVEIKDQQG